MSESLTESLRHCTVCPRRCGADRTVYRGRCGASDVVEVSKIMLHHWEEPCVSGGEKGRGSGAVFFAHCSLGCVYCQNRAISGPDASGEPYSVEELAKAFLRLEGEGAYNLNLVTPTHYTFQIREAVALARERGFDLPVIWNTGGYERWETILALAGTVDVFLTDFKYLSPLLSNAYSHAPDYGEAAEQSLLAMRKVAGVPALDEHGMIRRGIVVRHLVLPGGRRDSLAVLRRIASLLPPDEVVLSLMSQYTPEFFEASLAAKAGEGGTDNTPAADPMLRSLRRRVTAFEYESVREEAVRLGFSGYGQERSAASGHYTPSFDEHKECE